MNNYAVVCGFIAATTILIVVYSAIANKRKLALTSLYLAIVVITVLFVLIRQQEAQYHWLTTPETVTNGTYEVHGSYYNGGDSWFTILQPTKVHLHQLPNGSRIDSVPMSAHSIILGTPEKIPGPQDTNFFPIIQISGDAKNRRITPVTPSTLRGK